MIIQATVKLFSRLTVQRTEKTPYGLVRSKKEVFLIWGTTPLSCRAYLLQGPLF